MMNAVEKFHALMLSEDVRIWHYFGKKESPRFFYWLTSEPGDAAGYGFDTLEAMIDAAYARIDPMLKPHPATCPKPEQA